MRVICVMVSSLNGKVTDGEDPTIYNWTSKEDQVYFSSLIENAECIIMGQKTYEQAKNMMLHKKERLRIVLTSKPELYKDQTIRDQLEFISTQPKLLLSKLEDRGYKNVLLVGGPHTNTAFLEEGCINELWLTLEPLLFPGGNSLFTKLLKKTQLKLTNMEKLNEQGTLLLKYMFDPLQ